MRFIRVTGLAGAIVLASCTHLQPSHPTSASQGTQSAGTASGGDAHQGSGSSAAQGANGGGTSGGRSGASTTDASGTRSGAAVDQPNSPAGQVGAKGTQGRPK